MARRLSEYFTFLVVTTSAMAFLWWGVGLATGAAGSATAGATTTSHASFSVSSHVKPADYDLSFPWQVAAQKPAADAAAPVVVAVR